MAKKIPKKKQQSKVKDQTKAFDNAGGGSTAVDDAVEAVQPRYPDITDDARGKANAFFDGRNRKDDYTFGEKVGFSFGLARGNWQQQALEEGTSVLGLAGRHAARGAVWGGLAGGTLEAMQGGDFWQGAKQGAFNGAVGWTGYRMAMRGAGIQGSGLNVVSAVKGMGDNYGTMWRALDADEKVSKGAREILRQRHGDAMARYVMNYERTQKNKKN